MMETETSNREVVITRIVKAPRELVFNVWTHPDHVAHWWGPKGFTTTTLEMNVKAGGVWRFVMHGRDGVDYPNRIEYREVVKPERLVFDHGSDDDPKQFLATILFEDRGSQTELIRRMVFRSKELRDLLVEKYGAIEDNKQMIDKLDEYLHRFDENS